MATVTPEKKVTFKMPADVLKEHRLAAAAVVQPTPLIGTWVNADKATRGLVKLVIAKARTGVTVHGYGACSPTPCDWKAIPARVYAPDVMSTTAIAFSATYEFGFAETLIVGRLVDGALVVETFDHFLDGSGRSDYAATAVLYRS